MMQLNKQHQVIKLSCLKDCSFRDLLLFMKLMKLLKRGKNKFRNGYNEASYQVELAERLQFSCSFTVHETCETP